MILIGQANCDTGVVFGLDDSLIARKGFLESLESRHELKGTRRLPPVGGAPTRETIEKLIEALSLSAYGLSEDFEPRPSPLRVEILEICGLVRRYVTALLGDAGVLVREPRLREAIESFNWILTPSLAEAKTGRASQAGDEIREEFKEIENQLDGFTEQPLEIDEVVSVDFGWYFALVRLSKRSKDLDLLTIPRAFETGATYTGAVAAMTQLCTSKLGEWTAGNSPRESYVLRLRGMAAGLVAAAEFSSVGEGAGLLRFFSYYEKYASLRNLREGLAYGVDALAAVVGESLAERRRRQERVLATWGLGLATLATLSVGADVIGGIDFSSLHSWEWGRRLLYIGGSCLAVVAILFGVARWRGGSDAS